MSTPEGRVWLGAISDVTPDRDTLERTARDLARSRRDVDTLLSAILDHVALIERASSAVSGQALRRRRAAA